MLSCGCLALALLQAPPRDDPALHAALAQMSAARAVLERAEEHRVQVLLARAEADAGGRVALVRRGLRADREYVHAAGALGLPLAVAALEELNELRAREPRAGIDTPLAFQPLFAGEVVEDRDVTNLGSGAITLRGEIRKLFLAADDAAFNRLYELVGQDPLAARLARAGLKSARIVQRLAESRSEAEDRRTPAIDFVLGPEERLRIPERTGRVRIDDLRVKGIRVGTARIEGGRRLDGPLSFARRNAITLVELQDALVKLVQPEAARSGEPYAITAEQRSLLVDVAAELPGASRNPRLPREQYPDEGCKPLLPGLERVAPRADWRVVNKLGRALGFTVENAWVVHVPSGRGLFVTAAILADADGVVGDGLYAYDSVADPFLAALGELVGRELAGAR